MAQQLLKKGTNGYENVDPKTFTEAVKEKGSNKHLDEILSGFNSYFVSYNGSRKLTRLSIISSLRRRGLYITYILYNDIIVTEYYNGTSIDDASWGSDDNWLDGTNRLVGDISISSNGTWVINGVDSGLPARGEKGDNPILKVSEDGSTIQYSYNCVKWYDLLEVDTITPKINISKPAELAPGSTPTVENEGDDFNVELKFGLPKSPEVNIGSTTTIGEGNRAKVTNSGTKYAPVLDFQIPKGDTGRGITIKGFYPDLPTLQEKITAPAIGDVYCVGTEAPYVGYVWTNVYSSEIQTSTPAWQPIGEINKDTTIIVNDLGDRKDVAMSQKGTTENINNIYKQIEDDKCGLNDINDDQSDLSFQDNHNNIILEVKKGNLRTLNFDSLNIHNKIANNDHGFNDINDDQSDLSFIDEKGNVLLEVKNGDIMTKKFNSSSFNSLSKYDFKINIPNKNIILYSVCNDLDKSNNWGIHSRNYGFSVYLDHFFSTKKEIPLLFSSNLNHYVNMSQEIYGTPVKWNNEEEKYEKNLNFGINDGSEINITLRTILNSSTSNIKPIVLLIGDSTAEGWMANFDIINAPRNAQSWADYLFKKDKKQNNDTRYDCLFVGHNKYSYNFDDIEGYTCCSAYGGKQAEWYYTSKDSPFYDPNLGRFSLRYYLSKYKTLDDDGVTRLVVGSTAGTSVTDVNSHDLCTPNIVVLQLGMNGTSQQFIEYMPLIIDSIKNEYSDIKIIISIEDAVVCNYPSLYPDYDNIFFNDYGNDHEDLMADMIYAVDNMNDEENGIYVIYTGATIPLPEGAVVREIQHPLSQYNEKTKRYVGVDDLERIPHPSTYGMFAIGYQLHSAIKWILK